MSASTPVQVPALIEDRTIAPVPATQRYGKARDLFTLWFGGNITLLSVVNGALATTVYGEPLWLAVLALVLGNLVGGIVMALHSAQGPRLGVPQLVQTRAQFGRYGALLVVLPVLAVYVGFLASGLLLAGQSLNAISSHISIDAGIIAVAAVSVLATIFGYNLIHAYARVMTFTAGAVLLLTFAWIFAAHHLEANFLQAGEAWCRRLHRGRSRSPRCGRSPTRLSCATTRATCPRIPVPGGRSGPATGDRRWARSCPWFSAR